MHHFHLVYLAVLSVANCIAKFDEQQICTVRKENGNYVPPKKCTIMHNHQ